ncbi:flagellar basal body P-ring formation chaperone FlgA [Rubripirellula obstinata]|uniref:flagellar basal body P-ring formation chaperone FlgA n=1 Tax=Rubripirellula obstinata TaxID=406547 RepID=UPI00122D4E97|nr:flagellar basal body P-ring formation chaperone FlgA [Rubripirellula obstinata]
MPTNASRTTATTRWAFETRASVVVSSPIVRLGDVIKPINPGLAAWQRLSQSPIGLVPVGGQAMTIDRDRLTSIILGAEATPHSIDWMGPETIHVHYHASAASNNIPAKPVANPLQQTAYQTPAIPGETVATETEVVEESDPLSASEFRQVLHWIDLAIRRFHPDIDHAYEVEIPTDQRSLESLRHIVRVNGLTPVTEISEGECRFKIDARKLAGPVSCEITINLTAHPMIVVASRTLGRGELLRRTDLELKPIQADKMPSDAATEIVQLVGKEARAPLRSGQPISQSDVGSPILIHRGDLIEIRVLGGGVSVSTNAKAMGNGAKGELIELETMNPRKRLVARVADIGVAEILTRAPVVR